jgi:antitoxin component of MazEF toxin-antitoxin module
MFRLQQLEDENKKLRNELEAQIQTSITLLVDNDAVLMKIVQNQQEAIKDLQKRVNKLESLNSKKSSEGTYRKR